MGHNQYDELTSEDDDGAPPFASEYDEEESREAYQRAAYREAIAHFLPLPRTSYFWSLWQERVARDRQERVATDVRVPHSNKTYLICIDSRSPTCIDSRISTTFVMSVPVFQL